MRVHETNKQTNNNNNNYIIKLSYKYPIILTEILESVLALVVE